MSSGPALDSRAPRVVFLGSYVPRRCGIATFTHDLANAVAKQVDRPLGSDDHVTIVAVNDAGSTYDYGPEVARSFGQDSREEHRRTADLLNASDADVVCLQHEFGLFGGEGGIDLLELVNRLRKPLVTTLHTILVEPSPAQRKVLEVLVRRSQALVVMSKRARAMLHEHYETPPGRVRVIHHGAPDVPFRDTEPYKTRFGLSGRPVILTFGLLNPDKGIETTIEALKSVVPESPDLAYVVLGITHPLVRKASGESYRLALKSRIREAGLERNVEFHDRYTTLEDLCHYLMATDVYVTPYAKREQTVSGTLAYAAATGRAVVSTPYWYAEELLADGRGRLMDFGDARGLAAHLRELLGRPDVRNEMRRAIWDYGRGMIWGSVAKRYLEVFEQAVQADRRASRTRTSVEILTDASLPDTRWGALSTQTDATGILQHSTYSTPNREHGYATDDNARALIVTATAWSLFADEEILPPLRTYLSFLDHAHSGRGGRFRNFLSEDGRWLDEDGGDDCQGRVIWALGEVVARAPTPATLRSAEKLFRDALNLVPTIRSIRGRAFTILGLDAFLRAHENEEPVRSTLEELAVSVAAAFPKSVPEDGWPWCEEIVTYDNARLPQALLVAGARLDRRDLVALGERMLRWLLDVQTAPSGWLSVIGNDGWLRRGGTRPPFDQQPLEAAALVAACHEAQRATGERSWRRPMQRSFEWFLGRNDHGRTLIDLETHACHDGLTPQGLNGNQGAESTLSWLLSLLTMHEAERAARGERDVRPEPRPESDRTRPRGSPRIRTRD